MTSMKRYGSWASLCFLLGTASSALSQPEPAPVIPELAPAPTPIGVTPEAVNYQATDTCFPRIWVTPEYLLWWIKNGPLPTPLVTSALDPNVTNAAGFNVAA